MKICMDIIIFKMKTPTRHQPTQSVVPVELGDEKTEILTNDLLDFEKTPA